MRIISWNVRGLRSHQTVQSLCRLVKDQDPCMLFLMETRVGKAEAENLRVKLHFEGCLAVEGVGLGGGLMLLWKRDVVVEVMSYSVGHIDSRIRNKIDGWLWRFTGFYGNSVTERRKESWKLLSRLGDLCDLPWVCGGDFNEILSGEEKVGGNMRRQSLLDDFRGALDHCALRDLGCKGGVFTWCNERNPPHTVWVRLDRFCANSRWIDRMGNFCVELLVYDHSDHYPIALGLAGCPRKKVKKR